MTIAFHFATLVHVLRPLDFVVTQLLFTGTTARVTWQWNAVLRLLLTDENSRGITVPYLQEQKFFSIQKY